MSGLRRRLRKLEQSGALPCSSCGQLSYEESEIIVRAHRETQDEPEGVEYCKRCGRTIRARIVLSWD